MSQNQPTLQNLIDEVMEEFEARNKEFLSNHGLAKMEPDLGAVAGWKLGFIECKEWNKDFLRQSLIKIAKATAEAGRVEEKNEWKLTDDLQDSRNSYVAGYDEAVRDQQQKLKGFMGEHYEESKNKGKG